VVLDGTKSSSSLYSLKTHQLGCQECTLAHMFSVEPCKWDVGNDAVSVQREELLLRRLMIMKGWMKMKSLGHLHCQPQQQTGVLSISYQIINI